MYIKLQFFHLHHLEEYDITHTYFNASSSLRNITSGFVFIRIVFKNDGVRVNAKFFASERIN